MEARFRVALVVIASVGFGLRLAFLGEMQDSPLFASLVGDGWQYSAWAERIAGGAWIGSEPFYQAPLYPYFLALIYSVVGPSLTAVRVVQALFGAVSCVLLGVAGRAFFTPRIGLLAAGLFALYPWGIFSDGLVQKSSLDGLLVTALLAALGVFVQTRRTGWITCAGALLAALSLNRESTRVLYPVIVVWLLWVSAGTAERLRRVAVFTFAGALVLLPAVVHNLRAGGEFLLSTWQLGPNFYIGNHHGASGTYEPLVEGRGSAEHEREDATNLAVRAVGRTLSPSEVSGYWFDRALADIKDDPAAWVRLSGRKLLLTVNDAQLSDTESLPAYARESLVLRALRWLDFGILFPLAALGVVVTRREWKRVGLLYDLFVVLVISVAAFFVFERYRYPFVPIVMLFAAAGIDGVVRFQGFAPRVRTMAIASAVAAAILAHLPIVPAQADTTLFNVGLGLLKAGKTAEAIPVLQQAVASDPRDGAAHYALGVARDRTGDKPGALESFRTSVTVRPDDWEARSALGLALQEAGNPAAAAEHFAEAARLNPGAAAAHTNLGSVLAELGDRERALAAFRESLRLRPDDATTRRNYTLTSLAVAAERIAQGQPAAAVPPAEEAVTMDSESFEARYVLGQAYAAVGRVAEALASFEASLTLARRSGRTEEIPRIEQAIALCRRALR